MSKYANRIGVVSLQQRIETPSDTKFDYLYQAIGLNTGNFMFTNAVYRQIDGDLTPVGFAFNPEQINKDFDALVVPAANWINERTDWGWLIDLLEKINIPVITIGIGLQAESMDIDRVRVNESSMRLIKLLSGKSKWISCRGDFTRKWLVSVGVNNAITTGCPSIYMNLENKDSTFSDSGSIILQGTRYWVSTEFINSNNVNRKIYSIAGKLNLPIIYQSEPEEIDYLVYSKSDRDTYAKQKMSVLAKLYSFSQDGEVKQYLTTKGRLFFDVDQWSSYVKANMGVIGTRLHGAIIALNSGKPARLISHDSRTQEVADFAGIPSLSEMELDEVDEKQLEIILNDTDITGYEAKRKINSLVYRQFIEDCGLKPKDF
jgi:polysaccharide pyruvyl transferase WcaK-like protein